MAERRLRWLLIGAGGAFATALAAALLWLLPEFRSEPEMAAGTAPGPPATRPDVPAPAAVANDLIDDPPWTGDLDGMVERRLVRLLVVPNRTDYYLDGGEPKGQVAEYGREYERRLNRRFQTGARPIRVVFVPVMRDGLMPGLTAGKGDIAAANLTITPERLEIVDFSPPFRDEVREILVTGPEAPQVTTLDGLSGQEIVARRSSSYWPSLEALDGRLRRSDLEGVRLRPALEILDDEDLLELVASGYLPWAVVDDHKASAWARALPTLTLRDDLVLRSGGRIGWAFRKHSPQLAKSLASFVAATAKGTEFGNVVANRYLVAADQLRRSDSADRKRFLELLSIFRKWGEEYRLDPLLLAAQGFQESGLNQKRRNRSGATGIMQIRPSTARDPAVAVGHIDRVDNNIQAGAKYLRHLIDQYFDDPGIPELDRMLFALAAYNAGPGRIAELRRRAARRGLDSNRWFGGLEIQAERDIGRETVAYVGNIVKYYTVYRGIIDQEESRKAARRLIVAR
ncbi:MAG: transporter substrate-binding domain-containing protein [Geminicoccaceae bacterium]